jgi:hypothetical protein
MTGVSVTETPQPDAVPAGEVITFRLPRWFRDRHGVIAAAIYLVLVLSFEHQAVGHLGSVCACESAADPTQWMWSWAWLGHALLHLDNPLYTHFIWVPQRFNLAATTLAPATAIPGVPLEALFGPVVAYNLLTLSAPIINGWAAYRLCRYLSGAPWASILAGYTYGFSAYELDQMLGHLHLIFVFVPPLLVLVMLRYLDGELSARRTTVYATILLLIEFGLSTEILFDMTFVGALAWVFAFAFAPDYRGRLLRAVRVLAIAYVVMLVICAYYIHVEFQVPSYAKYAGLSYPGDLMSYIFPTPVFKLGGTRLMSLTNEFNTPNTSEQNQYLGIPLCLIVLAVAFDTWRFRVTKIVVLTTLAAFLVTLGTPLYVLGHGTFKLPLYWLEKLPVFDLILPTRLGVFVALGAAVCAALWISWAASRRARIWRWAVGLAAVAFLLPNLSFPDRTGSFVVPTFFTKGVYRHYLAKNEVVLTLPFSNNGFDMLWQADTHLSFRLAGGYFGVPPARYAAQPIVGQLLANAPGTGAVADLRSFVADQQVGAILVQDGQAGAWPAVFTAAGWRMQADVGGIEVFKPDTPAQLAQVKAAKVKTEKDKPAAGGSTR